MSTVQSIKNALIDKISNITDKEFLEALDKLITSVDKGLNED